MDTYVRSLQNALDRFQRAPTSNTFKVVETAFEQLRKEFRSSKGEKASEIAVLATDKGLSKLAGALNFIYNDRVFKLYTDIDTIPNNTPIIVAVNGSRRIETVTTVSSAVNLLVSENRENVAIVAIHFGGNIDNKFPKTYKGYPVINLASKPNFSSPGAITLQDISVRKTNIVNLKKSNVSFLEFDQGVMHQICASCGNPDVKFKLEPDNLLFCSKPCADQHLDFIEMKRGPMGDIDDEKDVKKGKDDEEELPLLKRYPYLLPMLTLIRMSGKYNMMMYGSSTLTDIYTSLVCLCAFYKQIDHVQFLVNLRGRQFGDQVYSLYLASSAEELQRAYELARAMAPYGKTFIDSYSEARELLSGELDSDIRAIITYIERHTDGRRDDISWAQAVIGMAEEKCLQKGIFARDVVEIRSLRGEFDQNSLKIAGAQLLN